jgi:hypothetical protein
MSTSLNYKPYPVRIIDRGTPQITVKAKHPGIVSLTRRYPDGIMEEFNLTANQATELAGILALTAAEAKIVEDAFLKAVDTH